MSNLNEQDIARYLDKKCKHCTSYGECTLFNTECDRIGYCGVSDID